MPVKEDTLLSCRITIGELIYDNLGLLKLNINFDDEISPENVREMRREAQRLTNGKPHVLLMNPGSTTTGNHEAREESAREIPKGRLADAIIISSTAVRLMARFYLFFHKPSVPTKTFNDEESAIEWLNQIRKENGLIP